MSTGEINPWFPEQDQLRLAVLGKLIEECNELSARAARCIIQGVAERDPASGLPNLFELEKEAADVLACIAIAGESLGFTPSPSRMLDKRTGYRQWHRMIRTPAE
ncbi:MAG TPA: hypothetical protein VGN80_19295 [Devosiaceae bacterium]|nr:hypothetical protein [Devosiaceae bacterium]